MKPGLRVPNSGCSSSRPVILLNHSSTSILHLSLMVVDSSPHQSGSTNGGRSPLHSTMMSLLDIELIFRSFLQMRCEDAQSDVTFVGMYPRSHTLGLQWPYSLRILYPSEYGHGPCFFESHAIISPG